jgi:hypothetical protein
MPLLKTCVISRGCIQRRIGFDLEFCTVSLLCMLKYEGFVKHNFYWATMGGGRIIPRSLKTTGNKNCFQPKIFYLFKSYMTPLFLVKVVFPKFDPLTVTGMTNVLLSWAKMQNLFCLVCRR